MKRLHDQYLQYFYSELSTCPKLITYNEIKRDFIRKKYLDCVTNDKHRIALSRFRCSTDKLLRKGDTEIFWGVVGWCDGAG